MRRILFYFMLSILIADLYVGLFLLSDRPMVWQLLWWLPTIATLAGILMVFRWFTTGIFTFIIAMLLCLEIPKMLFAICSVIGLATSFVLLNAIHISNAVGILLAAAFSMTMLYGFIFGWRRLKVNEIMLEFENLPTAFDGYRIVQLSDLHLGSQRKKSAFIKKLVNKVNLLNADAIVFTGDLVNRSADEATPFIPILSSLVAKDGVYAVLGNHDYTYPFRSDSLSLYVNQGTGTRVLFRLGTYAEITLITLHRKGSSTV